LLKRFPDFTGAAPGCGVGAVPGVTFREGRGRGDLTALAGTAIGLRVVELLGGDPAGAGTLEEGLVPRVAAIPIFGASLGLNFSACRVAVAGAAIGGVRVATLLSKATAIFSTVRVN
jgi:hypothetical protein